MADVLAPPCRSRSIERIFATKAALTNQAVEVGGREVILAQPIHGLLTTRAAILAVVD
jgi:hypothetical protein